MNTLWLYNNNPTNNGTEITWLFQNSVKIGTKLDKELELRCILIHIYCSNSVLKISSWMCNRKLNKNYDCEKSYSKSQYWKGVQIEKAEKMFEYNSEC